MSLGNDGEEALDCGRCIGALGCNRSEGCFKLSTKQEIIDNLKAEVTFLDRLYKEYEERLRCTQDLLAAAYQENRRST